MSSINQGDKLLELFKKSLLGDEKSYGDFLKMVAKYLKLLVVRRVPNKDVEDVVQEILISIHKARHTFDCKRPIMPWINAIARFRVMDYLRKIYSSIKIENIDFDELQNFLVDVTPHQSSNEYINDILKNSSKREKEILIMMHVEGFKVKEVASKLKMSESAVKVAAHRAIKKIKINLVEWK